MSDSDIIPWVALAPSRQRAALQAFAFVVTLCTGVAVAAGAVQAPGWGRWLAVAGTGAALVLAAVRTARARTGGELRVPRSGSLLWRPDGAAEPVALAPVFCSRWLIVLAAGPAAVDVWSDQLDGRAFRRLSACARWRVARTGPAPVLV